MLRILRTDVRMLRSGQQQLRFAAHQSSGVCRNQRGHRPKNKNVGLRFLKNRPVPKGLIAEQPEIYHEKEYWVREPVFKAGRNTEIVNHNYDVHALKPGVMTVRRSKINPSYKWIDIEPDIQKVYRSQELQRHHAEKSQLWHYDEDEAMEMQRPDWRADVAEKTRVTDRFVDPNLLTRGIVRSISPVPKTAMF